MVIDTSAACAAAQRAARFVAATLAAAIRRRPLATLRFRYAAPRQCL